jgi:hypothetical protein
VPRKARIHETGPFAMLPDDVLLSEACRTLPHPAHRVLVVLAAQYFGRNNGSLSLTRTTAAKYGMRNPHTLDASFRELEERGLILRTRPGSRLPPRSALYAITWRPINEPKEYDRHDAMPTLKPSNAYAKWKGTKQRQHWAAGRRRAPRYACATRPSSAGIHGGSKMSSAGIHKAPASPVAQGHGSDISGVGAPLAVVAKSAATRRSAFAESA